MLTAYIDVFIVSWHFMPSLIVVFHSLRFNNQRDVKRIGRQLDGKLTNCLAFLVRVGDSAFDDQTIHIGRLSQSDSSLHQIFR